jgi:hypothetical protein
MGGRLRPSLTETTEIAEKRYFFIGVERMTIKKSLGSTASRTKMILKESK